MPRKPRSDDLGAALAGDEEIPTIKPRSRAARDAAVAASAATFVDPIDTKKTWIVLEENSNIPPTGQFLSVNGRTFMLRPGYAAQVPVAITNVLDDAVEAVPEIDETTKQVVGFRNKMRFPYRPAKAEEIRLAQLKMAPRVAA